VYKTDFATSQDPYEQGYKAIFVALDEAESMLSTSRYLAGDIITEADRRYLQP
jgi:putative glutathione S-transferase